MGPVPTTLEEALAENALLRAEVVQLREMNRLLLARVEELERRLEQSSKNSSKPPSSDPPWMPRAPKEKPTGRRPGGQPGHKGHKRELAPPERVNQVEELWPERCDGCSGELPRAVRDEVGEADIHQVWEIPELAALVTEYRLHAQCCPSCGWATTAELPEGVPRTVFGPNLQAAVALCTGVYQLSKRQAAGALGDLFKVPMSTGSVVACEQRVSNVLAAPAREAEQHIEQQRVVHADETGWREGRKRAWLWVAVAGCVSIFLVHARRGADAMRKLLGRFSGILVSDRWIAYEAHKGRRQLCWAHLVRYFVAFSERQHAEAADIGRRLLSATKKMFHLWRRVRDGTLPRAKFQERMKPLRTEIEMLILAGEQCVHPKVAGTCSELWRLRDGLWTFVDRDGVEPTNNAAERALRPAVVWRKKSFGTHSQEGSRFIARMLTVSTTLRLQGRNVMEYLADACRRTLVGHRPHSILPGHPARLVPKSCMVATAET